MYTHPDFARRGVGRRILALCEAAAADAGFTRVELMATLRSYARFELELFLRNGFETLIILRKTE